MKLIDLFVSTRAIRTLVRDILQCGCPDTVFKDIKIGLPSLYNTHKVNSGLELLVGGRLLIALIPFSDVQNPDTDIPSILDVGRKVRDEHGFNRFRLVVVGVANAETRRHLQSLSASLGDRVHLHLLEESDLQRLRVM